MKLDDIDLLIEAENKTENDTCVIYRSYLDIKTAPFGKWNPAPCSNTHFKINAQGEWFHNEQQITRLALIQLFSKVMVLSNNQYFLKTPSELVEVQVEDCPFIVIGWAVEKTSDGIETIIMETNVGERYEVNSIFHLNVDKPIIRSQESFQSPITLSIRSNFKARLHRNVYYQLMERIVEVIDSSIGDSYEIVSGSYRFKCH